MAEQLLCASLWVQDKWHRGSASEEAPLKQVTSVRVPQFLSVKGTKKENWLLEATPAWE